jgi:hypothetical protein
MMFNSSKQGGAKASVTVARSATLECIGSLSILVACVIAMLLAPLGGCSTSTAHAVDGSRAREALITALDHWKQGDSPSSLSSSGTPMTVQDFEWERGARLKEYQLVEDGQARGDNLSIKVKLTLSGDRGKPMEKTVYYLVGTSPSVTVFRDMLRR